VKALRAALLTLHVAALAFGVYVAGAAVDSFFVNVGTDITTVAASRAAVAASLIAVAFAYAALLWRNGFALVAPPLFTLSYVAVGIIVDMTTRAMAKGFATAEPSELPVLYARAIAEIAVVTALAFLAWRWTRSRSRFPLV
jgi:hypothetical protein